MIPILLERHQRPQKEARMVHWRGGLAGSHHILPGSSSIHWPAEPGEGASQSNASRAMENIPGSELSQT